VLTKWLSSAMCDYTAGHKVTGIMPHHGIQQVLALKQTAVYYPIASLFLIKGVKIKKI
jgi:hypothetical protein